MFERKPRKILLLYQKVPPWQPEKPDMYWCAPARTPPRGNPSDFSR